MKAKIQYDIEGEIPKIKSFCFVQEGKVRQKDLKEDEVLIACCDIPKEFYSRWYEYIIENKKIVWSPELYIDHPIW